MQRLRIVAIGDHGHPEFAAVEQWLRAQNATRVPNCAAALGTSASHYFLLAPYRSAFDQAEVERLYRAAPLAKLVAIVGSWCEGETRSGQALAGVARVAWHQFVPRAEAILTGRADYAGWSLPRTASPIDVSLHANPRLPIRSPLTTIGVVAQTRGDYLAWAEGLIACGARAVRTSAAEISDDLQAVLWDGRSLNDQAAKELMAICAAGAAKPILALLDAPRIQEIEAAGRMGVASVLAKPLLLGDLRAEFTRLGVLPQPLPARQAG